jgi:L-aspartate oxidase
VELRALLILKKIVSKNISTILIAGDGLCNPKIVEIVVKEGVDRIRELIEWGAQFDKIRW